MSRIITYRGTVQQWHCDHMGHMNVMWYVGKMDEATWSFFSSIGVTPTYIRDSHCGMAAVQQNISYRRELMAGDSVEVYTVLLEIRDRVIRFTHEMRNIETGEVAAMCELTGVHMDRVARKSVPFPEAIRASAQSYIETT